jgi:tRNA-2-methylthio-N6-dimethylallyladenosine synthase
MIVGYPGETEDEFEESLSLYQAIGFDAAFMVAYSPRPGTAAAAMGDQVPRKLARARLHKLIALQTAITVQRNTAELGRVVEVLVEGPAAKGEGLLAGKTRTNKQVVFAGDEKLTGSLVSVRLSEANLWGFRGEVEAGS